MNLELKEFGITLAIGVFLLALLVASLQAHFYRKARMALFSRWPKRITASPMFVVVAVFGAGIVGETLSNKMVDDDLLRRVPDRLFATEAEMRTRALFGFHDAPGEQIPPVARDLAFTGRLSSFMLDPRVKKQAETLEKRLVRSSITRGDLDCLVQNIGGGLDLKDIAVPLYYTAKNTLVFAHSDVANELATIQSRLDFCRSLAFCGALFLTLNVVITLWRYGRQFFRGRGVGRRSFWKRVFRLPSQWRKMSSNGRERWRYRVRPLLLVMGLAALLPVTIRCYESEEREFNIRTYGYFASLSDDDLPKRTPSHGVALTKEPEDISGAVRLQSGHVVVIRDTKAAAGNTGFRAGVVNTSSGTVEDLMIKWKVGVELASDLEAACRVPGSRDILMCESGYYPPDAPKPKYGRLFRCTPRYDDAEALTHLEVIRVWQWPKGTTDIEGLACVQVKDQVYVIAANRGGTLHWCPLNDVPDKKSWCFYGGGQSDETLVFSNQGKTVAEEGKKVSFPFLVSFNRKISDLYVSSPSGSLDPTSGRLDLWACAADEPPESGPGTGTGPFKSVVYHLGKIGTTSADLVVLSANPSPHHVPGHKVEALAEGRSKGELFIGTDDESLGGMWQFLTVGDPQPNGQN